MEKQKLMVGYDLCTDYSQISYYNIEKDEPDAVELDGQAQIPTVLCRLFAGGEWLAGQQAVKAAQGKVSRSEILQRVLPMIRWWMWLVREWRK